MIIFLRQSHKRGGGEQGGSPFSTIYSLLKLIIQHTITMANHTRYRTDRLTLTAITPDSCQLLTLTVINCESMIIIVCLELWTKGYYLPEVPYPQQVGLP